MILNDRELQAILERLAWLQAQVSHLRSRVAFNAFVVAH